MQSRRKMSHLLLLLALIALLLLPSSLSAQVVVTVAGGYVGDGGPATAAALAWPTYVARDVAGNLYICEMLSHRVRKVDAFTGIITTVAGTGLTAYNGDGGLAVATNLSAPTGMLIDPAGDLIIAEQGHYRVRKVDHVTGIISTIAGNGNPGSSGDGGPATDASLSPWALALDTAGNLFVAETGNHVVRKIDKISGTITTVAGNGVAGYSGDGGLAILASLNMPRSMLPDAAGNLYIADTMNRRVRKVSATGLITTVAGNGEAGFSEVDENGNPLQATAARIGTPRGLAFDSDGNLLISNAGRSRIRKVDLTTGIITTAAGSRGGFDGDGHAPLETRFGFTTGLWLDSSNQLLVADNGNSRVRKVDFSLGTVSTLAGGFIGDGNPATSAFVSQPQQSALDVAGNLYIADTLNYRVRKVDVAGIVTTVAGTGIDGYSGDGGPGVAAQISSPYGVAVDAAGNVFIADTWNGLIRKLDSSGTISLFSDYQEYAPGWGYLPFAMTFDAAGTLYFADQDCLVGKVDPLTGLITTVAGIEPSDAVPNTCGYNGDGILATVAQVTPYAVAADATGNLYIADGDNNRVRKVDNTGMISTVAGNGTCAFSGDNGPATDASLCYPTGVALDKAGNLFIADQSNYRIRKVTPAGTITTIAGTGEGGYSGEGVKPLQAVIESPVSVAVDSLGNVYINELYRIRKIVQPRGMYLHGSSSKAKATLFLDYNPPALSTAKRSDSPPLQFRGGNPWQAVGAWPAAAALTKGTLYEVMNLRAWLGLQAKGEKGTNFDLRAEVYKNGSLLSAGETHCVKGLATNPREITVALDSFLPQGFNGTSDQIILKVFARMGTTEGGASCGGPGASAGVRLHFDAVAQPTYFDATLAR